MKALKVCCKQNIYFNGPDLNMHDEKKDYPIYGSNARWLYKIIGQ